MNFLIGIYYSSPYDRALSMAEVAQRIAAALGAEAHGDVGVYAYATREDMLDDLPTEAAIRRPRED